MEAAGRRPPVPRETGVICLKNYDVIIIGRGPAGISAALYTVRANLSTLVVGRDASALLKASKIENYFGFASVSGAELLERGAAQAKALGAELLDADVTALGTGETFTVRTAQDEFAAPAVLIATGQAPRRPKIPGIAEFEGKGVSYCTTCDGFFYRGKKVGILGGGDYAVQEAMELEPFTKDITLYLNGDSAAFTGVYAEKAAGYRIVPTPVKSISGSKTLGEIDLETGREKLDGLFVASGTASSVDFAVKLGVEVRDNAILAGANQATNLPGIFAAGDCTGGFKQVSVAVGQGALAGRGIIEYVRRLKADPKNAGGKPAGKE